VLSWQPPARLVLAWRLGADWQYHADLLTEVEVRFTALSANLTRVEFEHRLLENMGPDAQRVRDQLNGGWPGILDRYTELCGAA